MELKRVVVTGMGAITPIGNSANEYWMDWLMCTLALDMITLF